MPGLQWMLMLTHLGCCTQEGRYARLCHWQALPWAHHLCHMSPVPCLCSLPPTGWVGICITPWGCPCWRPPNHDILSLQKLKVNAIHVYSVDSALNLDNCMSQLSIAGIYTLFVLLACFTCPLATEHLFLADNEPPNKRQKQITQTGKSLPIVCCFPVPHQFWYLVYCLLAFVNRYMLYYRYSACTIDILISCKAQMAVND